MRQMVFIQQKLRFVCRHRYSKAVVLNIAVRTGFIDLLEQVFNISVRPIIIQRNSPPAIKNFSPGEGSLIPLSPWERLGVRDSRVE